MSPAIAPVRLPAQADHYRQSGYWTTDPVPDLVGAGVARHPARPAVIDRLGTLTYAELGRLVDRASAALHARGLRPGDVAALQLPNWREFVILQQACARLGVAYVPLVTALREDDLRYILSASKAAVLAVPRSWRGFDHAELAMRLRGSLPDLREVIVAGGAAPSGALELDELLDRPADRAEAEALAAISVSADAVRAVMFTSGTESRPKGVLHSFNTAFFPLRLHRRRLRLNDDEVVFTPSPVGHGTGAIFGSELAMGLGGTVVLQESWDAAAAVDAVARHRCTMMWGATTFYTDFVRSPDLRRRDVSTFRLLCSAGSPIPRDLLLEVKALTSGRLISAYGQSEGGNMSVVGVDDPEEKALTSDGRLNDDLHVRIVDADGSEVAAGTPGELVYRGPGLCLGYLDEAHTHAAFEADGAIRSGDLVTIDAERFLRVVGRRKEIIIRGGENISPAEVEHALYTHPAIAEVSVVGIADARLGQRSCAVVVIASGSQLSLADIKDHMASRGIAKFKWPELLVMADSLPRTPTGKVRRDELRRTVEASWPTGEAVAGA